jgi:hypothetical protein
MHSSGGQSPSAAEPDRHPHPNNGLKTMRQVSVNFSHHIGHALGSFFRSMEEFLFPRMLLDPTARSETTAVPRVLGGVLLRGCETAGEHHERVRQCLSLVRDLHGEAGLRELGLEYRLLLCEAHRPIVEETGSFDTSEDVDDIYRVKQREDNLPLPLSPLSSRPDLICITRDVTDSIRSATSIESVVDVAVSIPSPDELNEDDFVPATEAEIASGSARHCHLCMRRLYHSESDALIDDGNRQLFIADGDMYEEVARLCQEYAHYVMCREGNMAWVTIEPQREAAKQARPPIEAMVNKDHPIVAGSQSNPMSSRPSLLIATGRGKVRAGIFSRQHLICSGLESATAVPIVREAQRRRLNIVIVDPNIHGDAQGFTVFEKTMDYLSNLTLSEHSRAPPEHANDAPLTARDLYVLSHSASGGHLARYLLDKSERYLPHIRAIAFTDSTHNIQWTKTHNNSELCDLLESPKCVYFRSSNVRVEDQRQWYLHRAGEEIQTDTFWQHRFGRIKTCWAGTNEHSMTNWYAHGKIWEHFDSHLGGDSRTNFPAAEATAERRETSYESTAVHDHYKSPLREPGKVVQL